MNDQYSLYQISPFAENYLTVIEDVSVSPYSQSMNVDEDPWSDLKKSAFTISGYKNFDFQYTHSSTSTASFQIERSESLKLQLNGHSMGTTVNVDINQSSANNSRENKQRIELIHPQVNVLMGDFETHFSHLALLNYQDLIEGTQVKLIGEDQIVGILYSNPKGNSKKEVLYGNNSQGPYGLSFTPIVPQSEKIKVKGLLKEKDKDYQIDYISGKITFIHSILTPEDDLVVTYDSENVLFKDQVLGASYRYSGIPSSNIEFYFLQKRSAQDSLINQKEISVAHFHHESEGLWVDSELGISQYTANTLEPENKQFGKALSLKSSYTANPWMFTSYYTKLGHTFQTVDASMAPGDYLYGAETQFKQNSNSFLTSYSDHNQTIGSLVQEDKVVIVGGATLVQSALLSTSGKIQNHTEYTVSGNVGQNYQRRTLDLSLDMPLPLGKLKTLGSVENKQFSTASSNSYTYNQVQSAYSVDLNPLLFSLEGGAKVQHNQVGGSTIEKTGKMMGRWDHDSTNLTGFIERREKTDSFPITVINEALQTKLTTWISFENRLNLESLNEIFNGQTTDTEKIDSHIQATLEPFPRTKLKVSQKNRSDKMKETHVMVYDKQERTIEFVAPCLSMGTWSLLKSDLQEYKTQTTYYPNALFSDGLDNRKSYIGKLQLTMLETLQSQVEYERVTHEFQALTATSSAQYSLTSSKEEKFKSALNYPVFGTLFGAGYESDYLQSISPSRNLKTQVTYSIWDKITLWETFSLKGTWNYSQNEENGTEFVSQKPEVDIDYRVSTFATFNLHYAYLTEFRPTSTDISEFWTIGLKVSLIDHILMSANMTQENHSNPGGTLFQANSQVSIIF